MRRSLQWQVVALMTGFSTLISHAQTRPASEPATSQAIISTDTRWMVVTLLIAAAIILAAMIVGPVIRANMADDRKPVKR